jgi:radical SAM protein with 4Fe4S-binding SPASM domain
MTHDPITQLPILILFPHSRCNCRCVMCDIWRSTAKDELSAADVARWLTEWQALGVQHVVLSGGEALMHSHLWELCARLRSANIQITLLSTGLLLKRHAANVARYCNEVIISLDGPRHIHNAIRQIPHAYEKLAEGVAAVRAETRDSRSEAGGTSSISSLKSSISIVARCTVQRRNFDQLRAVVRSARAIGLDHISFLAADVSTDAFNRPTGWDEQRVSDVALNSAEVAQLAEELDALEREHPEDFASGFIVESPTKLRRRLWQYYAALLGQQDFYPVRCNAPWVSTVIEADGTVRPCFFQPPLGNIHQAENLQAILNSAEALHWRRGLDTTRDAICKKCVCSLWREVRGEGHV